jgi:hypothetical protein
MSLTSAKCGKLDIGDNNMMKFRAYNAFNFFFEVEAANGNEAFNKLRESRGLTEIRHMEVFICNQWRNATV